MTSWSFSHYSLALQCLRKYKYIVVDKLAPEGPESSDLIFGSALHSAINACLTGQDGAATFELYWESYKERNVEYGRFNWEQLAQIGAGFIRKFAKFHAPKYELVFAEERLYAEYKGTKLEGTLDFYGKYNGRTSLRDFKTSSRNYDQAKTVCATQLYLYAYLAMQNGKDMTDACLGYTVFNKATGSIQDLTWEFSASKMKEALDELVSYVEIWGTDKKTYVEYPKNYGACLDYNRKCQFFDKCHKENNE